LSGPDKSSAVDTGSELLRLWLRGLRTANGTPILDLASIRDRPVRNAKERWIVPCSCNQSSRWTNRLGVRRIWRHSNSRGIPARLVPDNLKTGVDKPDLQLKPNTAYADLAAHYQTLVDPARAHKLEDKPRAE